MKGKKLSLKEIEEELNRVIDLKKLPSVTPLNDTHVIVKTEGMVCTMRADLFEKAMQAEINKIKK